MMSHELLQLAKTTHTLHQSSSFWLHWMQRLHRVSMRLLPGSGNHYAILQLIVLAKWLDPK